MREVARRSATHNPHSIVTLRNAALTSMGGERDGHQPDAATTLTKATLDATAI